MLVGLFPMVADVIHPGHIAAIKEAKKHCDYLIVALHCDPVYKVPVQSIFERYMQLDAIKYVDKVIPYQNRQDAAIMIATLDYDIYFLGEDYKNKSFECSDLLEQLGKHVCYLRRSHTLSSTDLKNRIRAQGDTEAGVKCDAKSYCG
jgi:glycerol-3-phosphate cytidylyltransferase